MMDGILLFVVPVLAGLGAFGGIALRGIFLKSGCDGDHLAAAIAKIQTTRLSDDDPGIEGFLSLLNEIADGFVQQHPRWKHRRILHGARVKSIWKILRLMNANITVCLE